ncbi:MAG: hypothetical protein AAF740_06765 [Bacteroidota bacterium]
MKEKIAVDSNILILLSRNEAFGRFFNQRYLATECEFVLCFASEAEPKSLSFRKLWGERRNLVMQDFITRTTQIRTVSDEMIQAYIEIEAYSLCQHPILKKPQGETAHKMGKNDLWIAATTLVHAQKIVTTDKDFIQLDGVFFDVDWINIADFA